MAETKQGAHGKVFISYSRKDKAFVQKLNDALHHAGVQAWVDWEGIELASDWMKTISDARLAILYNWRADHKYWHSARMINGWLVEVLQVLPIYGTHLRAMKWHVSRIVTRSRA